MPTIQYTEEPDNAIRQSKVPAPLAAHIEFVCGELAKTHAGTAYRWTLVKQQPDRQVLIEVLEGSTPLFRFKTSEANAHHLRPGAVWGAYQRHA